MIFIVSMVVLLTLSLFCLGLTISTVSPEHVAPHNNVFSHNSAALEPFDIDSAQLSMIAVFHRVLHCNVL